MARVTQYIPALLPTTGSVPSGGYDATSNAAYTAWELNDEARVTVTIPDSYESGSSITLEFNESTPTVSKPHKWQVKVLLMQPGTHATNAATEEDTVTSTFTSSGTANLLTAREIELSSDGTVSGTTVAAGNELALTISRETVADNDTADIKLFSLYIAYETGTTPAEGYAASRLAAIEQRVKDLANDDDGNFVSQAQFIRMANWVYNDIAKRGYFSKQTTINAVADQYEYDLQSLISDIVEIETIRWHASPYDMVNLTWQEYDTLYRKSDYTGDYPYWWTMVDNNLWVVPAPEVNTSDAFAITHTYQPTAFNITDSYTPATPEVYDDVYVFGVLWQWHLRDIQGNPSAARVAPTWDAFYLEKVQDLIRQGLNKPVVFKPWNS